MSFGKDIRIVHPGVTCHVSILVLMDVVREVVIMTKAEQQYFLVSILVLMDVVREVLLRFQMAH